MVDRHLGWQGTYNSRDLGGMATAEGGVNIPLDMTEDREFWDVWEAGPRSAAVLRAIATAPPGGSSSTARAAATGRARSRCGGLPQ
jgi:hypothetical protein